MIDNLLSYPPSCIVGKVISKATFFRNMEVTTAMKRHFQDDVVTLSGLQHVLGEDHGSKQGALEIEVEDLVEASEI